MFLICFNSVLGRIQKEFGSLGYGIKSEKTITVTTKDILGIGGGTTKETVIENQRCLMLAYVDDILIFTENHPAMMTVCDAFETYLSTVGLGLNYDKSKWFSQLADLSAEAKGVDISPVEDKEKLIINDVEIYKLKYGETFTYLGSCMEFNGGETLSVKNYIKWIQGELDFIDGIKYEDIGFKTKIKSGPIKGRMKFMLYKQFIYRRTKWDFMRTIWSDESLNKIEAVETKYLTKWVSWNLTWLFAKRRRRTLIVRETRCLNAEHSMMRLYAQLYYGWCGDAETKALMVRLEKLTKLTKKLDDEFNSTFAADYDEIEKL